MPAAAAGVYSRLHCSWGTSTAAAWCILLASAPCRLPPCSYPLPCCRRVPACCLPAPPLQSWEEEEYEAYAMFEAVVASEATRPTGNSAAARKLQRNKNIQSSAATPDQLLSSSKADYRRGVPMTAAQKRLVKNKLNAGGLSVMQQAALLAGAGGCARVCGIVAVLPGQLLLQSVVAGLGQRKQQRFLGDCGSPVACLPTVLPCPVTAITTFPPASLPPSAANRKASGASGDSFELVAAKPLRPGAALAAKPARPAELEVSLLPACQPACCWLLPACRCCILAAEGGRWVTGLGSGLYNKIIGQESWGVGELQQQQ